MSNRRKPNKPWLTNMEPGATMGVKSSIFKKPNRRRAKALKRRIHINTLILEGKMK